MARLVALRVECRSERVLPAPPHASPAARVASRTTRVAPRRRASARTRRSKHQVNPEVNPAGTTTSCTTTVRFAWQQRGRSPHLRASWRVIAFARGATKRAPPFRTSRSGQMRSREVVHVAQPRRCGVTLLAAEGCIPNAHRRVHGVVAYRGDGREAVAQIPGTTKQAGQRLEVHSRVTPTGRARLPPRTLRMSCA